LIFAVASERPVASRVALEAEILVPRQQINVLRRANPIKLRFVSIDDVQDQGEKRGPQYCHQPSMATSNTGSSIPTKQSIIQRIGAPSDSDHALTNPSLITILASGGDAT
jgi:hypothetical protein